MIDRERLEDLVLARLSVSGARPLSKGDLARAMEVFLERELGKADARKEIVDALARLRESGCVDPGALALTAVGTQRLCAALDVSTLPSSRNWGDFKRKHLIRLSEKGSAAADPATLGLKLVARKLGLPERSARSEAALANACLARALGLDGDWQSPFRMRTASLAASLGVPARPKMEDVLRISIKALSGARSAGAGDVAQAIVARWLTAPDDAHGNSQQPASEARPDELSLDQAVQKVRDAARGQGARRFGSNKVFIASVWESLRGEPEFSRLGEQGFKELLVAAHQRGELTLARADLVAAMDPGDVAASETRHLNATYHFIQDSGEHS